jgi:HEPN domain-containing protein
MLSEKIIQTIITGTISEVIDPERNFKKVDCEKCVAIAKKVMETLKELGLYKPE